MTSLLLVAAICGVFLVGYMLGFGAGRSSGQVSAYEEIYGAGDAQDGDSE